MLGLYLHIPYCRYACAYCNFHFSTTQHTLEAMIEAMCQELALVSPMHQDQAVHTVYLGGGTPSLLPVKALHKLITTLRTHFNTEALSEFTLEANPEDVSKEQLATWKSLGVNRISLGVQSFQADRLKRLGRAHQPAQGAQAVLATQDAGMDLSLDLIYGSESDPALWSADLAQLFSLSIAHFSAYALTVEPKTALYHQVHKHKRQMPNQDAVAQQLVALQEGAQIQGYTQYEVSAFALEGHQAQHNQGYWTQKPYVGIGPSAHSYCPKQHIRWYNVAHNAHYIQSLSQNKLPRSEEKLSPHMQWTEYLMTRLRTSQGAELEVVCRFLKPEHYQSWLSKVQHLCQEGLCQQNQTHVWLSPQGLRLADSIIVHLV